MLLCCRDLQGHAAKLPQSRTKDLSTDKCTIYAAKKCTNRSFLSSFTNESQLISETILMKPSFDAAPPFPPTWQHGLSKGWDEMCQQRKEMLQNFWKFGILCWIHKPFSCDYESQSLESKVWREDPLGLPINSQEVYCVSSACITPM